MARTIRKVLPDAPHCAVELPANLHSIRVDQDGTNVDGWPRYGVRYLCADGNAGWVAYDNSAVGMVIGLRAQPRERSDKQAAQLRTLFNVGE